MRGVVQLLLQLQRLPPQPLAFLAGCGRGSPSPRGSFAGPRPSRRRPCGRWRAGPSASRPARGPRRGNAAASFSASAMSCFDRLDRRPRLRQFLVACLGPLAGQLLQLGLPLVLLGEPGLVGRLAPVRR